MKRAEEVMEILEAFDLVGTLRGAAELVGCDHKTVAHYVAAREAAGGEWRAQGRACPRGDTRAAKIAEWVERSQGKVRADKVHERLLAIGLPRLGADDTPRRGPRQGRLAGGQRPRHPAVDPRAGTVDAVGLRRGPADRRSPHLAVLRLARLVALPRRPAARRPHPAERGDGARSHPAGDRRVPDLRPDRQREDGHRRPRLRDRGAQPEDRRRLAPLRADGGELRARRPADQGRFGGDGEDRQGRSGPHRPQPAGRLREPRRAGGRLRGLLRARQRPPAPDHPAGAGGDAGRPRPRSAEEVAFLAIGPGAERWLTQAAAAGASRVRSKIAAAVELAALHGAEAVDQALKTAAEAGRFGSGDLASILAHRRRSGLPAGKTLEAWDEEASSIPVATQQALRTLEWVEPAEALCLCGPSGTGKSHFVEALGHLAIDRGKAVAWHTLESLEALLRGHRADGSVTKAIAKLLRADLVIIDDVGMLPVSAEAAEALFRLVDATYERRSIAITSNLHPSGFDELMPRTLAAATVDRLLHHAHVVVTEGTESYRLAQATDGKGVMPLA